MKQFEKFLNTKLIYAGLIICFVFTYWISRHNSKQLEQLSSSSEREKEKLNNITLKYSQAEGDLKFLVHKLSDTASQPKIIHDVIYKPIYINKTDTVTILKLRKRIISDSLQILLLQNYTTTLKKLLQQNIESYKFCRDTQVPNLKIYIDTLRIQLEQYQFQLEQCKKRKRLLDISFPIPNQSL